jgi:hypothetical protein
MNRGQKNEDEKTTAGGAAAGTRRTYIVAEGIAGI